MSDISRAYADKGVYYTILADIGDAWTGEASYTLDEVLLALYEVILVSERRLV